MTREIYLTEPWEGFDLRIVCEWTPDVPPRGSESGIAASFEMLECYPVHPETKVEGPNIASCWSREQEKRIEDCAVHELEKEDAANYREYMYG